MAEIGERRRLRRPLARRVRHGSAGSLIPRQLGTKNGRHGRARHVLPGAMGSASVAMTMSKVDLKAWINLRYNGSILDIRVCDEKSFKFRRSQPPLSMVFFVDSGSFR
uniref:Uncharacterized protein n=1 Tax=Oryza nivara TaxID=4536 RepID=A0A0E0HUF5_ORYNI